MVCSDGGVYGFLVYFEHRTTRRFWKWKFLIYVFFCWVKTFLLAVTFF